MKHTLPVILLAAVALHGCGGSGVSGFKATGEASAPPLESDFTFNGYTNHWQNHYRKAFRQANLYRLNTPDVEKTFLQSKLDLAEALGLPGLRMQEGFLAGLLGTEYFTVEDSRETSVSEALGKAGTVLAFVDRDSDLGRKLSGKDPLAAPDLGSYQTRDPQFRTTDAFTLEKGKTRLHIVLGRKEDLSEFRGLLENALGVAENHDLHRGWFGVETHIRSVTCMPGNPLDIMGIGMNEGNSWFVFSGNYEFLIGDNLKKWVDETGLKGVVTDLGANPIYGCDDWDGLQVQEMRTSDDWAAFQRDKRGYIFRDIPWEGPQSGEPCDGYFATTGNAEQVALWDKPFVLRTGPSLSGLTGCMVLFTGKGETFDRKAMWDAIMTRRSVCVAEGGIVMGEDIYRKATQLLMLDRQWIEEYFGDRISMTSSIRGHTLSVRLTNTYPHRVKGTFELLLPDHLSVSGEKAFPVSLATGESKTLEIELLPSALSMGRISAVVSRFDWGTSKKSSIASYNLPPAISTHELLYGPTTGFEFPVSVHNFTAESSIPVSLSVMSGDGRLILGEEAVIELPKGSHEVIPFNLKLSPGAYTVKVEAMGVTAYTQLGVGSEQGEVTFREEDLDGDGVNEYIMENSKVRVTLLSTGARVIEYYLKSKDDNIFFKLWPDKPVDEARPNRKWGFYPYGGFEDFLGQASVETHKVYDARVIKAGGDYAEVKMRADYYGSVIEKTFTLWGDSPLLGISYALDMAHPEMNVLGPQPIIEIGKNHGTEDKFIIPELDGLHSYTMDPVNMYGKILYLKEGWNAAYDTREDISFVGAYPVGRPYYLHVWMNLDVNPESHYPYTELQPWLPLYNGNTSYFSYYMWTEGASWEKSLKELRDRNLITSINDETR